MRKNKLASFTALVLLVTIIALVLVSGTYAKYTTELSANDTATVAKFAVGGLDSTSFDLFATAVTEVDGTTADEDVAEGKIAPGTGGKFTVTLTNNSDVAVEYTLALAETENENAIPIEYSLNGSTYVTAANFASASGAKGTLNIGSTTPTTKELVVYWRWAYVGTDSTNYQDAQTDETDTALGTAGTATVKVTATATFTQVD